MAVLALPGRVLVEEDLLSLEVAVVLVAPGAGHVLMQALQWKLRALVVIEVRRFPFGRVVTVDARRGAILDKLLTVNILMTFLTQEGSCREVCLDQLGLHIGRFVAIDASRDPVRSYQWKLSLRVVETREVLPILSGMTGLAANRCTVRARLLHVLGELAFVRIFVAGLAVQVLPVVEHDRLGLRFRMFRFLMAIGTGYSDMAAR